MIIGWDVQDEIEALTKIKTKIFGRSNHAAIDAQIEVLECDLDEDEILGSYGENVSLLEKVMYTRRWLNGTEKEPSSEHWMALT